MVSVGVCVAGWALAAIGWGVLIVSVAIYMAQVRKFRAAIEAGLTPLQTMLAGSSLLDDEEKGGDEE